jgi:hypothetical protein
MTAKERIAIALLGFGAAMLPLAGCQGQSPLAPGGDRPAAAAPSPGGSWQVTRTVTEISDPSGCYLWQPRVGAAVVSGLEVRRSDGPLRLVLHPRDEPQLSAARTEYAGTVDGYEFIVRTESVRTGYSLCREGTFQATVTGNFSHDGRSLVGEEVWVFGLDHEGEAKVFFTWAARSQ